MNHATTCKFCKKPIVLIVDDEYPAFRDPYKLFAFAACNRCADLRERRTTLEDQIRKACLNFLASKSNHSEAPKVRSLLEILTQKYTRTVADWVGSQTPWWDKEIVESLMENPSQVGRVLALCWSMYQDNPNAARREQATFAEASA